MTFIANFRLLVAILFVTASPSAFAYLDPGTGSLIIQSIIGALAAIGVTTKLYWHKIKLMFGKNKDGDLEASQAESKDQQD